MPLRYCMPILLFVMLSSISCRECPNYDIVEFQPAMYKYFGMYKPGNWWTYENADGSLNDSLYVYGFKEFRQNYIPNCINFPTREVKVRTLHMVPGKSSFGIHYTNNSQPYVDYLDAHPIWAATINGKSDTHPRESGHAAHPVVVFDTITMAGVLYNDVLRFSYQDGYTTYFAPNVGLVRLINLSNDTFTIKDFYTD